MSDGLVIQSHAGPYPVTFHHGVPSGSLGLPGAEPHFLIDAKVARLYAAQLRMVLDHENTIVIESVEHNKSLRQLIPVFERLVRDRVRRDHVLIAIGGGIIQDITAFTASTLLRGVPWRFLPTTLLAQADSCIGSKSSINLDDTKNVLGTFYPPQHVHIHAGFLDTLEERDLRSGIGEILKVHAIEGKTAFDRLAAEFDALLGDRATLLRYVRAALSIKQRYIEADEFDRGIRNIFNYGHSFGHAIESATLYAVPHGVAVTMGMDMANFIAVRRGLLPETHYQRMHPVLRRNYAGFAATAIPTDALLGALMRDKKNTSTALRLIFPVGPDAEIQAVSVPADALFRSQAEESLRALAG